MVSKCSHDHPNCPGNSPTKLPTRVIEIIDEDHLRLASEQPDGLYAALSYCWGGHQPFQTTRETSTSNFQGFTLVGLPKTLQDAILLTRKLGLQFLWVDSLCIVQDDSDDKAKELSKMAEYYTKAHITICAADEKCTTGFLAPHSKCEHHPDSTLPRDLLQLQVLDPAGNISILLFRPETPYIRRTDGIER